MIWGPTRNNDQSNLIQISESIQYHSKIWTNQVSRFGSYKSQGLLLKRTCLVTEIEPFKQIFYQSNLYRSATNKIIIFMNKKNIVFGILCIRSLGHDKSTIEHNSPRTIPNLGKPVVEQNTNKKQSPATSVNRHIAVFPITT